MGRGRGGSTSHGKRTPGGIRTSSQMSKVGEIEAKDGVLGGEQTPGSPDRVDASQAPEQNNFTNEKVTIENPNEAETTANTGAKALDQEAVLSVKTNKSGANNKTIKAAETKTGLRGINESTIDDWRKELGFGEAMIPKPLKSVLKDQPVSKKIFQLVAPSIDDKDPSGRDLTMDDMVDLFNVKTRSERLTKEDLQKRLKRTNEAMADRATPRFKKDALSDAEQLAVNLYTHSAWTGEINDYLRTMDQMIRDMSVEKDPEKQKTIKNRITDALANPDNQQIKRVASLMMTGLGKLILQERIENQPPRAVTRRFKQDVKFKKGDVFYDPALMSTGNASYGALELFRGNKALTAWTKQGADITDMSSHFDENEVLVFPGTLFKVDHTFETKNRVKEHEQRIAALEVDTKGNELEGRKGTKISDQFKMRNPASYQKWRYDIDDKKEDMVDNLAINNIKVAEGMDDPIYITLAMAKQSGERVKDREAIIKKDPAASLKYAKIINEKKVIKERFEAGEEAMAKDPDIAVKYALLLGKRFEAGEDAIAKDANASVRYARNVVRGRFEKGEAAIAKDPEAVIKYASTFGRFKAGEKALEANIVYFSQYLDILSGEDLKEYQKDMGLK